MSGRRTRSGARAKAIEGIRARLRGNNSSARNNYCELSEPEEEGDAQPITPTDTSDSGGYKQGPSATKRKKGDEKFREESTPVDDDDDEYEEAEDSTSQSKDDHHSIVDVDRPRRSRRLNIGSSEELDCNGGIYDDPVRRYPLRKRKSKGLLHYNYEELIGDNESKEKQTQWNDNEYSDETDEATRNAYAPKVPYVPVDSKCDADVDRLAERMFSSSVSSQIVSLNKEVTFAAVGGHGETIHALRETVLLPLMYPSFFTVRGIKPPRGVLFFGAPGTGKTLLAEALANECSSGPKRVNFITHTGTDFLSKWFGESERCLRELFEKARACSPCIVYLDEIDGLAPARSSGDDGNKLHNTIVTTLLGLMDGIGSGHGIVVIGSTNRVDAIDPALRRPGRFDREFYFGLPKAAARQEILSIHTRKWIPVPSVTIIQEIALHTKGFCGADLQALCREAMIIRVRRKFPQIYNSKKLVSIEKSSICVSKQDFYEALEKITPASVRSAGNPVLFPLPRQLAALLETRRCSLCEQLTCRYPSLFSGSSELVGQVHDFGVFSPRLLVCEEIDCGYDSFVVPSVLHSLEITTHTLNLRRLYDPTYSSMEQAVISIIERAEKECPSAIFLRRIDSWWETVSETVKSTLLNILQSMSANKGILVVATISAAKASIPDYLQSLFIDTSQILEATDLTETEIHDHFLRLFTEDCMVVKTDLRLEDTASSCRKSGSPPSLTAAQEEELWEQEERELRSFRAAARKIVAQLMKDRQFAVFKEAVKPSDAQDYYRVIVAPMDLSVIMSKIDRHNYFRFKELFDDVKLIATNAIKYNPDEMSEDRKLRQRACNLLDVAQSIFDTEISKSAETNLTDILEKRRLRGALMDVDADCVIYLDPPMVAGNGKKYSGKGYAFVRYEPIIATSTVTLRNNAGMESAFSREDSNWNRIVMIAPVKNKVKLTIEVIPHDLSTGEGGDSNATTTATVAENEQAGYCTSVTDEDSELYKVAQSLARKATQLVQKLSGVREGKLKGKKNSSSNAEKRCSLFQNVQKLMSHINIVIRKHATSKNKQELFDQLLLILQNGWDEASK